MADRVRMKSKSSFANPFIFNHTEGRLGSTAVQEGDEFSTEPEHADQLEPAGLAEKIGGDVSDRTDKQEMIKGAQTPSTRTAIVTNRKVEGAPAPAVAPAAPAAPAKPAA